MDFKALKAIVNESNSIVFFGGAGVSTESSIPDFRSSSGLFQSNFGSYSPEELLSRGCLDSNPELFYSYYRQHMIYPDAKPNDAHLALARLEELLKLKAVITQNIDGLHQKAGSRNVIELHGSVERNYCAVCGEHFSLDYVLSYAELVPKCEKCGAMVRPDVVLYGEQLNQADFAKAEELIAEADVLIVAGTSLSVYPAAGLVQAYNGNKLILINQSPTSYDRFANYLISESVGKVMKQLIS